MATVDPWLMARIVLRRLKVLQGLDSIDSLRELFADASSPTLERMSALQGAWQFRRYPLLEMQREEWVAMFRSLGYFEMDDDGEVESRTRPPMTSRMYRGATPEYARGMSWSWSRRDYAALYGHPVWTAEIPSEHWLAMFHEGEIVEIVVDLPEHIVVERA